MRIMLGVLALFLAGCATNPDSGIVVRWYKHESKASFDTACEITVRHGAVIGCARPGAGVCNIHTRTNDRDLNDTLGHELRHCFEGNWH